MSGSRAGRAAQDLDRRLELIQSTAGSLGTGLPDEGRLRAHTPEFLALGIGHTAHDRRRFGDVDRRAPSEIQPLDLRLTLVAPA